VNLFLEDILSEPLEAFQGTVSNGGSSINNLCFLDDIDLLVGSKLELAEPIHALIRLLYGVLYEKEISIDNSKILTMGVKTVQPDIYIQ